MLGRGARDDTRLRRHLRSGQRQPDTPRRPNDAGASEPPAPPLREIAQKTRAYLGGVHRREYMAPSAKSVAEGAHRESQSDAEVPPSRSDSGERVDPDADENVVDVDLRARGENGLPLEVFARSVDSLT